MLKALRFFSLSLFPLLAILVYTMAITSAARADDVSRVVLFGGSSVATTYLPNDAKHHNALAALLKEAYPKQKIEVENWADNGEFIARYLLNGPYERHRKDQKGIDVAIIRFGTNDQKRMKVPEYHAQMLKFIELLKTDYPGIVIVLETGIYLDYPKHYVTDRNKTLNPYWEVSRVIAKEFGYPLVEYYGVAKREAEAGNWDIRIRTQKYKRFILDNSEDAGNENDPKWFNDIHPNPVGTKMAAREETLVLKQIFAEKLPTGQTAVVREAHNKEYYSKFLNFDAARLTTNKAANPEQTLQTAAQ